MSHAVTLTAPPRQFMLFTADCHIKQRTWTNSTLLKGDAINAFSKMISNTVKYGEPLKNLVIGGDLFDNNRPTSRDLESVHRMISNFESVYYIHGNHDNVNPSYLEAIRPMMSVDSSHFNLVKLCYDVIPDGALVAYDAIPTEHIHLQGLSWDPSDSKFIGALDNTINNWKKFQQEHPEDTLYLVLHCAFKHLLGFDGAYTLDIDMIKNMCGNANINFLVGHIHTRDTTVYNENGNYIHSPGALYPLSSDHMGKQHFASLINMVDGRIIDVPTDVRNYVRVNIKDIDKDIPGWLQTVPTIGSNRDLWELPAFITITVPEGYDKEIILPETDQYVFKIERRLADIHKTATVAGPSYSINDAIREELQNEANREMILEMAEELLASDDPITTLNEWLTFWGVRKAT